METPPLIFDPRTLDQRRCRVTDDGLFLQKHAQQALLSRLEDVNRTFTKIAVVTPFPELWESFGAEIVAPHEVLDFQDSQYDAVLHALCLHSFNDPLGQIIQCQRSLSPDGLFLASMFGGDTLVNLRDVLTRAELMVTNGAAPRVHPMVEIRDAGALLQRAGLALPVADMDGLNVSFGSLTKLMHDLREMGEANALSRRHKAFTAPAIFKEAAHNYPRTADDRIEALFEILYLSGWSPHDSQPKPLRPGSASIALSDFLDANKSTSDD